VFDRLWQHKQQQSHFYLLYHVEDSIQGGQRVMREDLTSYL